jgi:hypothetical protein
MAELGHALQSDADTEEKQSALLAYNRPELRIGELFEPATDELAETGTHLEP